MKVLITGATGLVGTAIVKELKSKGATVNYLTTSKEKIVSQEDYQGFYWQPATGQIDVAALEGVQAIINLAGATVSKRWTTAYKKEVLESRLASLTTLKKGLEQSKLHQVTAIVSASGISFYPDSLSSFYDETETAVDDSFLGTVVQAWEKAADDFTTLGVQVAKIRIGLVLSDQGGALPKMAKPISSFVGSAFGNGQQWQSWIHITDLARLFVFVLQENLEGTFNAVAPNPVTNAKLTKELAKVLKRPLLLPNVPKAIMQMVLGEMAYLLFASQRVSSKKIEQRGFVYNYPNICKALAHLYGAKKSQQEVVETAF